MAKDYPRDRHEIDRVAIYFTLDGVDDDEFCEWREWLHVPRVGELVMLGPYPIWDFRRVVRVVWCDRRTPDGRGVVTNSPQVNVVLGEPEAEDGG